MTIGGKLAVLAAVAAGTVFGSAGAAAAAPITTEYTLPQIGSKPADVAAGPDGAVWFTESATNEIGRISTTGTITQYSVPTSSSTPAAITTGPDGNLWFTENSGNKIGRLTTSGTFTEFSSGLTIGAGLIDIAAGPDGNLWFTENSTGKVGKITTAGTITQYSTSSSTSQPWAIVAGPDGNLWFTEDSGDKVARITTSGTLTEFSVPTSSAAPLDIAAGPDGNLWFTEYSTGKVGKITTAGTVTEYSTSSSTSQPWSIAAGPDGNLWFTENGSSKISVATTAGAISEYSLPTASSSPMGIIEGPDNRMWLAEYGANAIAAAAVVAPSAASVGATAVGANGATLNAAVTPNGQATSVHFDYGTTAAYGTSTGSVAIASSAGQQVSLPVNGLSPSTTYHYRVVATNAVGTTVGADQTFATVAAPPTTNPTTSPTPNPTANPTTNQGALPTPVVIPRALTVSGGAVSLDVDCPADAVGGCHGTVVITLVHGKNGRRRAKAIVASRCGRGCRPFGSGRYQVSAGHRGHVRVTLSRTALHMLFRTAVLPVRITTTSHVGTKTVTASRQVVLRRPSRAARARRASR